MLETLIATTPERAQLLKTGCTVYRNILTRWEIEGLREATARQIQRLPGEHLEAQKSTGTMVELNALPELIDLITHPGAQRVLEHLGFERSRYWSGYLISKPPGSPQLFWHQDWIAWDEARSYEELPPMLFFMYYLVDTCRENGCLRVIPGSHRKRNKLHNLAGIAHTEEIQRMRDPSSPAFALAPDEVDVPVRAGDLVVGDARLLHASHPNRSGDWRTVLTLWYLPSFDTFSEGLQRMVSESTWQVYAKWNGDARERLERIAASYKGDAPAQRWNRKPGPQF